MARVRSPHSFQIQKACRKLLIFAVTFIVFVTLQNLLKYTDPAWKAVQRETSGLPWWILSLSVLGFALLVWTLALGVNEVYKRLCGYELRNSYESLNSADEEDSDDLETGPADRQTKYSAATSRKKTKSSSASRNPKAKSYSEKNGQRSESDETSTDNPTDVDVTVHPVDTTIAAGGDARVSPSYNVSLMNFTTENGAGPRAERTNQLYPSAPIMQGGPAFFKREF